ncbi:MAG: 2OG-Fe(II) oxygenase [Candidatus Sericytochromatia bacterium]
MQAERPDARHNNYLTRPAFYQGLFSPEECRRIIALPFSHSAQARIFASDSAQKQTHKQVNEAIRKTVTHVVDPLPENNWIVQRVHALFEQTNQGYYNFRLAWISPLQVLEYQADGFYGWHIDLGEGEISTRKLSCVVFLSDPLDYAGGQLQIESPDRELVQEQGAAVIFPSYISHRVEPVTRGQRWTLVAWAHGETFK